MKFIGLIVIAAATVLSAPVHAQGIGVDVDAPGVRIEGGRGWDRDYDRDYRWRRSYNAYRDYDRDTVVVRRHRDWDRPHRRVIIDRDY